MLTNNQLAEFERKMMSKMRIISMKRVDPYDMSAGAKDIAEAMNTLADNVMISKSVEDSQVNLDSIRNIRDVLLVLKRNGQLSVQEFMSLDKMLTSMHVITEKEFKDRGGLIKKKTGKLIAPGETLKGKFKKQFKGSRKYATMATIAGAMFDSPAVMIGAQWLQARKEKAEEEKQDRILQKEELLQGFVKGKSDQIEYEKSFKLGRTKKGKGKNKPVIKTDTTKKVSTKVEKEFEKQVGAKVDKKLKPEQNEAIEELSDAMKDQMVEDAIHKIETDYSLLLEQNKGDSKKWKPILAEMESKLTEARSPVGRENIIKSMSKKKQIEKKPEVGLEQEEVLKSLSKKKQGEITYSQEEIDMAEDLKASASAVEEELGFEAGSMELPEDIKKISKTRASAESEKKKSSVYQNLPMAMNSPESLGEGITGTDEEVMQDYFQTLLPDGEFYELFKEFKEDFSEYKKNWDGINSEQMVGDRDLLMKDIHDNLEIYMESLGLGKGGKKSLLSSKDEGGKKGGGLLDNVLGGKKGGGVLSTILGGAKKFGGGVLSGMMPSAGGLSAGAGYTGVGGLATGIGGGLVLGAPIAALGLTLNHLWKKQQGVEDQEMASIVNSTGINKSKMANSQKLWNEFAKANKITPAVEDKIVGESEGEGNQINNRQEKIMALISKIRSGRAGKALKDKWTLFLAAKKGGVPQTTVPTIAPTMTPAATSSAPPSSTPTTNYEPIAKTSGVSVTAGTVKLANSDVDIEHLNPDLKGRMATLATGYAEATGDKLQINSGARTYEEQAALKRVNKFAASPDRSPHVDRGGGAKAFDAQSRQMNRAKELGLMESAGLDTPVRGEPWHAQASKTTPTLLASVTDNRPSATSRLSTSQSAQPTIIQSTNVIQPPDLRFFIDDPYLRNNNNNGIV